MKYALWNLAPESELYLSGPEETIALLGGSAEAGWTNGQVEAGADILGYVSGNFSGDLSKWNYREITQEEALHFCLEVDASAYLLPNGRITTPLES